MSSYFDCQSGMTLGQIPTLINSTTIDAIRWVPSSATCNGIMDCDSLLDESTANCRVNAANLANGWTAIGAICTGLAIVLTIIYVVLPAYHKQIRSLQPVTLMLTSIGCVIGYTLVYLLPRYPSPANISAQIWIAHTQVYLILSSVLSRIHRLSSIFRAKTPRKNTYTDTHIVLQVSVGYVLSAAVAIAVWASQSFARQDFVYVFLVLDVFVAFVIVYYLALLRDIRSHFHNGYRDSLIILTCGVAILAALNVAASDPTTRIGQGVPQQSVAYGSLLSFIVCVANSSILLFFVVVPARNLWLTVIQTQKEGVIDGVLIHTTSTPEKDTARAVKVCLGAFKQAFGAQTQPSMIVVAFTEMHSGPEVVKVLKAEFGKQPITFIGATSCLGVMTNTAASSMDGSAYMGMWAIHDKNGLYVSGFAPVENNTQEAWFAAGVLAVNQALGKITANTLVRNLEKKPDIVWMYATPGGEEQVIAAIQSIFGKMVNIAGGSAADNTISGNWCTINELGSTKCGVNIGIMWCSVDTRPIFYCGYTPTGTSGIVTKAGQRVILELDHQPAAEVYNKWANGLFKDYLETPTNILSQSALLPLGRRVGFDIEDKPCFQMLHPEYINDQHHVSLFANVHEGDRIELFRGSEHAIVSEISKECRRLMLNDGFVPGDIKGALIVYCAGCMMASKSQIGSVIKRMNETLNNTPFMGTFNFGEQGRYPNGDVGHGNLMFSVMLFSNRRKMVLQNVVGRKSVLKSGGQSPATDTVLNMGEAGVGRKQTHRMSRSSQGDKSV